MPSRLRLMWGKRCIKPEPAVKYHEGTFEMTRPINARLNDVSEGAQTWERILSFLGKMLRQCNVGLSVTVNLELTAEL